MGNNISADSYLITTACGGRNITHAYLLSNGTFPTASYPLQNSTFENCTNVARVLHYHCCEDGVCRPSPIDHEFERYEWSDWNGLGYPYVKGDGKVLFGTKGKDGKKCQPPLLKRGGRGDASLGMDLVGRAESLETTSVGYADRMAHQREVAEEMALLTVACIVLLCVGALFWMRVRRSSGPKDAEKQGEAEA